MVSPIKDLLHDNCLIEERPKYVVIFKLYLAINNICTCCVCLLHLLIVNVKAYYSIFVVFTKSINLQHFHI